MMISATDLFAVFPSIRLVLSLSESRTPSVSYRFVVPIFKELSDECPSHATDEMEDNQIWMI
jgi:hypothetical protein